MGMHAADQSVLGAFHRTVDRIAGAAQLQVTAGDAGTALSKSDAGYGRSLTLFISVPRGLFPKGAPRYVA